MKRGDKIVCIDNSLDDDIISHNGLTIGKTYTVLDVDINFIDMKQDFISIYDDSDMAFYFPSRFISVKKYRKQKLNKINDKRL